MANKILKTYNKFSMKQWGNPWVAEVMADGKIDFDFEKQKKVGYYSGGYGTGQKGDLIVYDPKEEQVYAYGRKNKQRKIDPNKKPQRSKDCFYVIYLDGEFKPCDRYGLLLDVWGLDKRLQKEYKQIIG